MDSSFLAKLYSGGGGQHLIGGQENVVEGVSLDSLLKYFSHVVSKSDLYNPTKFEQQQQPEQPEQQPAAGARQQDDDDDDEEKDDDEEDEDKEEEEEDEDEEKKEDGGDDDDEDKEKQGGKKIKDSSNNKKSGGKRVSNSILQMKLLVWKHLKETLEYASKDHSSSTSSSLLQSDTTTPSDQSSDEEEEGGEENTDKKDTKNATETDSSSSKKNTTTKSSSNETSSTDTSTKSIEMFLTCIIELITSKMQELKIKGYEMMQEYLQTLRIGSLGQVSQQIMTKIFDLLIHVIENGQSDQERIIASTTLISLVVARNCQSLTLRMIQFILSSKYQSLLPLNLKNNNNQMIPFEKADYKINYCYEYQNIQQLNNLALTITKVYSMTTDGISIFIHCNIGLLKISLHSSTRKYMINVHKKSFHTTPSLCHDGGDHLANGHISGSGSSGGGGVTMNGSSSSSSKNEDIEIVTKSWMFIIRDRLYFKSLDMDQGIVCTMTLDTLEESYQSIEDEPEHQQLGQHPYTLFFDQFSERIGVLEFIVNKKVASDLPKTTIRYIKVYDDHSLHSDTSSGTKEFELFKTKTQVQQFNTVVLDQESDDTVLKSLEPFKISKIFSSTRGGLFFQTKELNVYFLGSNGIFQTKSSQPLMLYSGDGWKQIKKMIWKEPEVLFLEEQSKELYSLVAPKKRDASQLKQFYSKHKVTDAIYYNYGVIIYSAADQQLLALDKEKPAVSPTKIHSVPSVPFMAANDTDFYYVDGGSKKLHSMTLDGKWGVQDVAGVDGDVLHLHAAYQSVVIVTTTGIYVKGNNSFGQLGLASYKDQPNAFTKIDNLPVHLDLQTILKVDSGLTFTLIATTKNQIFYSGNIKDHKQTNIFLQMVDFSQEHQQQQKVESFAKLIDISCTEYGFTVLREIYDTQGIQDCSNQFYNFNVYIQNQQLFGILLPFFNNNNNNNNNSKNNNNNNNDNLGNIEKNLKFKLYNNQLQLLDEIKIDKKDQIQIFDYPYHLSPYASFTFDNTSKNISILENVEQPSRSKESSSSTVSTVSTISNVDSKLSFYNSKQLVDPLVLVNSLLSNIYNNQILSKQSPQPIKIPNESKFLSSLSTFTFMVPRKISNYPMSSTISFIRVNHPILLKTLVIPKFKEIYLSYRIESSDGKQLVTSPKKLYKTSIIDLVSPFEMRPGVLYKIYFINQDGNMCIQGINYQKYSVAGVKIDMRPPTVYRDSPQILCGVKFSVLPSNSLTISATSDALLSGDKKKLDISDLKHLFESIECMWRQYVGTLQSRYTFEQKVAEDDSMLLELLEQPLPRAMSLLADNIATIATKDQGMFDDFINFLHQIYCNAVLFKHGHHANANLFRLVMTQVNRLFTSSFGLVYGCDQERVSCIVLLDQLLQVASKEVVRAEIPGIKYLLTSAISSLSSNSKDELKALSLMVSEEDAFITEATNPVLVNFYGNIQNLIYKEKNSKRVGKQKDDGNNNNGEEMIFINLLLSIASRINLKEQEEHDDDEDDDEGDQEDIISVKLLNYKLAANLLLETIWSSSLTLKKIGTTYDPPPVFDVARFTSTSSSWIYEDLVDSITFAVDRTIYVTGVGLYGDKGSYSAQVAHLYGKAAARFRDSPPPNVIYTQWHNQTSRYIHKIEFHKAVPLHPGEFLTTQQLSNQHLSNASLAVIGSPLGTAQLSTPNHVQCVKMESSHPYEECLKQTNVVEFPKTVKWMVIQFDQRSLTASESDRLIVWTKDDFSASVECSETPVGFSKKAFPKLSLLVPGNRLIFDFQTASVPNNNGAAVNVVQRYGYACNVYGYDSLSEDVTIPLARLERQLSFYIAQLASEPLVSDELVVHPKSNKDKLKEKQKQKDAAAARDKAAKGKKKKNANDSDDEDKDKDLELELEKQKQREKEKEERAKRLDFDEFVVVKGGANPATDPTGAASEKSKQFFQKVWDQVSSKVYSTSVTKGPQSPQFVDPQHSEFIQDFVSSKADTVGYEVDQFFQTIGYALSESPKAVADRLNNNNNKKKKEKDQDEKAQKDGDGNKDDQDDQKQDNDNDQEDSKLKDQEKEKEDKIKEKMKSFPINNEELSVLDKKTRLKQLKILIDRKKQQQRLWENKKKLFANNQQAGDSSDDSSSSDSSSDSSDQEEEELKADEESDDEFFNLNEDEEEEEDEAEKEKEKEKEKEQVKINDEESEKDKDIKDDNDDITSTTSTTTTLITDDQDKEQEIKDEEELNNQDNDEKESDDEKIVSAATSVAVKEFKKEKEKEKEIKEEEEESSIEIISTYNLMEGWDEASKGLFVEMLRLTGTTGDFVREVTSIKNHKKTFEESKETEGFEPFVSLWRLIQKKLNKLASTTPSVDDIPYDGMQSLFGEECLYEDTSSASKKLPFEKFKFLMDFFNTLEPVAEQQKPSLPTETDSSPSSSSSSSSRMIQYSFEELMNSSNINPLTFNLSHPSNQQQPSHSMSSTKIKLDITKPLLYLIEDKMEKIEFGKIIEEHNSKIRSKVDAIQTWVKLVEMVQSPSAFENVIWMLATVLHSKQAPKETLPQDWQGRVANNLLLASDIHPLCKKEFVHHFHALLETLSKRINNNTPYYSNDNIILNSLQCFSMYLLPEDIDFVQKSEIFPFISKLLSEVRSSGLSTPPTPIIKSKGKEKADTTDHHHDASSSTPESLPAISLMHSSTTMTVGTFGQSVVPSNIQNSSFNNVASKCKVVLSKSPEMMPSLFDNSTLTFWEASPKSTITITLDKPQPVQEIALFIDNVADKDYVVSGIKVTASCCTAESGGVTQEVVKSRDLQFNYNGWVSIALNDNVTVTSFIISFESSNNVRVYQIKVLVPEKTTTMNLVPSSKFEAALSLLKLLTFQIFGITVQQQQQQEKDKLEKLDKQGGVDQPLQQQQQQEQHNIKNHVHNLISGTSGISNIQKQIFSLISTEVQKEINHLDSFGWSDSQKKELVNEQDGEKNNQDQEERKAADGGEQNYLFELLTTLSSLLESEEGKSFLPSKSSIYSLLPLIHHGQERVQHICINICRRMLINIKPSLFDNFVKENQSAFIRSLGSFVEYLLLVISKGISLQVKGLKERENKEKDKELVTFDQLLPKVLEGTVTNEVSKELIEMLKELSAKSQPWKESIDEAIRHFIIDMKKQTLLPASQYLTKNSFWASLASLLVVSGNNEMIQSINSSDSANDDKSSIKLCQNHDDTVTEATVHCQSCEPVSNLCNECDRVIHLSKSKRDHGRATLANDSITIQVHESCIRLKLATSLFVIDVEKQKAIVQTTINTRESQEVCRFCKQKLDLENLLPSFGIANVCSSAECKSKAQKSCTAIHPCGHHCCGVRDELVCLPCLHGCKNNTPAEEGVPTKRLGQDCDDYCMICWTESLSEAPSIQLDCGHVLHHECTQLLLEKRWTGSRITFGFSKCPICKVPIHHPSLESITSVLDNIYGEIIKKGKLRLDFLGIKSDPVFQSGGKYENKEEDYIVEQFSYYLCFKCKKPYFGGMNQCAAGLVVPDKINEQDLICGSCSSNDSVTICPKHGKDYLEYKCRYCCSPSVWFCFGTTRFCSLCHDKHAELTSRSKHPKCPVAPGGIEMPGDICPLGIDHPPTGEEFSLGCGLCKYNSQNF
ncbi:RING zinc finger-containing protein [Cavenderia fasciculata]|uniref:RCR-type E3 ubiquitin transferase n=1 Tax=Cavenderia fasciculata TaxID=261658 RepID=F4PXT8_CACFS|nr:RING zinc finger-containing protein [Cavenderia fasciculata]EGG19598.1 RING zinc finger-containing protein [Cavenderia fasciculata]|eukprot:XP_004357892.1 RING zinc finger-containing protein [Cavenderia fasciculata]